MAAKKTGQSDPSVEPEPFLPRRLYRSSTNRVIAGVAGGLGEFFDIDPTIIRLIFVLLTFFGGSGIVIYIILWLIMPSDKHVDLASHEAIKANAEEMREHARYFAKNIDHEDRRMWFGIIIIIIGAVFLLDSLGFYGIDFGRLWPLWLIIIGVFLLLRQK